ncbi:glycosyltransferase family 2 protein [uncultured Roseovarius sp.]|uniref:glycosyltransferase family 2 protein n=1 Tax=uncultured Roseovarius sp. TaxID=293344 RepID=UPI00261BA2CA|nr:glycosyltransferase family 2 protein [uncultured Roseovarius sp.]
MSISDTFKNDAEKIRKSGYFDADWYLKTYPDVGMMGMDPAEHYLKYGAAMRRDPGPHFSTGFYIDTHPGVTRNNLHPLLHHMNRKGPNGQPTPDYHYVLWASFNLAKRHGAQKAAEFAEKFLPAELRYTTEILRANLAIENERRDLWLSHINTYLANFGLSPVSLKVGDTSFLSRLFAESYPAGQDGPLISVLMPAWNAEETVQHAAKSILAQSWSCIELIIVDDASTDGTWDILQKLSESDERVKILRNKKNVGPYVSKNIALKHSKGDFITGHDADDWAHPQRLENQVAEMRERQCAASLTYMVRMQPNGFFGHIGKVTAFSLDGVARKASISCMFERSFLVEKLGFWDSVRFGGDSEMIARAELLLGDAFVTLPQISMICLDLETSLTNHPEHGVDKVRGVSPIRGDYRDSWAAWHQDKMTPQNAYLDFPQKDRRYKAADEMVVSWQNQMANLSNELGESF